MTWLDRETFSWILNERDRLEIPLIEDIFDNEFDLMGDDFYSDGDYHGVLCALIAKAKGWDIMEIEEDKQ